jgi:hypothetical protein
MNLKTSVQKLDMMLMYLIKLSVAQTLIETPLNGKILLAEGIRSAHGLIGGIISLHIYKLNKFSAKHRNYSFILFCQHVSALQHAIIRPSK